MKIRTPYNYQPSAPRFIVDDSYVEYVDCSVDTALHNVENTTLQSSKPLYLDSQTPVKVFDKGILSTPYDPIASKRVASTRAQESQAAAAAPAPQPSDANNVNSNVQAE